MNGAMPGCPRLYFGVVDVRDVADLHIRAMTHPAAKGERFLAVAGDFMSMLDLAKLLKGLVHSFFVPLHIGSRREDRDPPERVQDEQISITTHDESSAPIDHHLQKLVIVRIAGGLNALHDLDDLEKRSEAKEQGIALLARHVAIELWGEQLR